MVCIRGPLLQDCVSRYNAYYDFKRHHEEVFIQEAKKYELFERDVYFVDEVKEQEITAGEQRLRKFEKLLFDGFSYKPHRFQMGFLKEAVKGLAELIVGAEDWLQIGPQIEKQRGWKEMSKMILAKAPRRFGKSMAVGMIVISVALTVPGVTVCCKKNKETAASHIF
jgi:hypothetical protein